MTDDHESVQTTPGFRGRDFYVTGGTLRPDALCYVERQADKDLYDGLLQGEFCYVLTSRQMGKSSLMVRTVKRLRQEGVTVAVLDLTAIGQNLTVEQWYDGLMSRLGQQLNLEDELLDFWRAHPEWGPLQRWITAIEKAVLPKLPGRVVVFVDEIDIVRSLPFSTDEFFAAIRECHNRRSREPDFGRLAFCLLGVATPTDLIRDTRMTPFNIGHRIELNDFTVAEASPLARGLGADESINQTLLSRILYWTGGHPYLTQRLCRTLAETVLRPPPVGEAGGATIPPVIPNADTVDQLAEKLFLSRQARDRDDNLIFVRERILRGETDVAGLLFLYRNIRTGLPVPDDETNPLGSVLRLSGITRGVNGHLQVRNRIYYHVFDLKWIQTNMPNAEVRRQRKAGHRGILMGAAFAVLLLTAWLILKPYLARQREAWLATQTTRQVEATYGQIKSYRDTFETTIEIVFGGTTVPVSGSGSIIYEKPNKLNLVLKTTAPPPGIEVRLYSDGRHGWVHVPTQNQYQILPPTPDRGLLMLPRGLDRQIGPMRLLPLYRMFLGERAAERFSKDSHNVKFAGFAELDGERTHILKWDHAAGALMGPVGVRRPESGADNVPVTAWVSVKSGLILQLQVDLSPWAAQLIGEPSEIPVTGLTITETHRNIETSPQALVKDQFSFVPSPETQPGSHWTLPPPNLRDLASSKRQNLYTIPTRFQQASSNQIDLTEYYNASLVRAWHPGSPQNSLEVLPAGLLWFSGTLFDVRGLVQLAGRQLQNAGGRFPESISGIKVGQACRELHFLHAAGWRCLDGTTIGTYRVHYTDGQQQEIPIVYGEDLRDWNSSGDRSTKTKRAPQVWSAINKGGYYVRLFKSTWKNPLPEQPIASIDFVSAMADSAPFLVAITATP